MTRAVKSDAAGPGQLLCLLLAIVIMLAGTAYPPLLMNASGRVDHGLAMTIFWAMSAGFVRGVGFIPVMRLWRYLFSGWACLAALFVALLFKFVPF